MRRRTLLAWGGAGIGALGLTLFAGWWRVDGPGAPTPVGQRPMALSDMAEYVGYFHPNIRGWTGQPA